MTQKKITRPDLEIPVEAWGTIKSATAKLTWFEQVDTAIAADMVGGSFAQLAINIATNPKGVNSQTGLTWRGARALADETGLTKSTVMRLLEEAVAAGLLFVVRKGRPGRDGQSTIYRLAMPQAENGPPVKRFQRKKRPTHETKTAGNGPSVVPETTHPYPGKRPTSGTHLLRDITQRDITPLEHGAHAHAVQSARVERGSVTETKTTSVDAAENPTFDTADDAAFPATDRPVPRALARTEPIAAQQQLPSRNHPKKEMGRATNGAHGPARFEVVKQHYPPDWMGDDASALRAFSATGAAHRDEADLIADVKNFVHGVRATNGKGPAFAEALKAISNSISF